MTSLTVKIRSAVSADRSRFRDGEFDLDLTYITSHVIAMAMPADGLEAAWRNHIDDVARMLTKYHGSDFLIINLSEKAYNYNLFANQILEYGFPDHFNPPLALLTKIVLVMDKWIRASPKHVAVIHCKGGKGRTGTVIATYLTYSGVFDNPFEALEFFAARRSQKLKGVTQPSQVRYVRYFGQLLRALEAPRPVLLLLSSVRLSRVPLFSPQKNGARLLLEVWDSCHATPVLVYKSGYDLRKLPIFTADAHREVVWDLADAGVAVAGDFLVKCYHVKLSGKSKIVFRTSHHTHFIDPASREVSLPLAELDDVKKPALYGGPDFSIQLRFSAAPPAAPPAQPDPGEEFYALAIEASRARAIDLTPEPRGLAALFEHVQQVDGLQVLTPRHLGSKVDGAPPSAQATSGFMLEDFLQSPAADDGKAGPLRTSSALQIRNLLESSSLSALSIQRQGYLVKKGGNRRNWRRRWFVLNAKELSYFADQTSAAPLGTIPLAKIRAVAQAVPETYVALDKEVFDFTIALASRTFLLRAASATDMDQWIAAIEAEIAAASRSPSSSADAIDPSLSSPSRSPPTASMSPSRSPAPSLRQSLWTSAVRRGTESASQPRRELPSPLRLSSPSMLSDPQSSSSIVTSSSSLSSSSSTSSSPLNPTRIVLAHARIL